jgi:predicted ABC-type ATPase
MVERTLTSEQRKYIVEFFLEKANRSEIPKIWFLAGGGGAGKTAIAEKLEIGKQMGREAYVLVNSDDVKEMMPAYQRLKTEQPEYAAALVHEESAEVADEILERALSDGKNVLYDGTMKDLEAGKARIEKFKNAGYHTAMVGVTVDPEVAIKRAEIRARQTGRVVPKEELWRAHRGANAAFEVYARLVDQFWLYRSMDSPYVIAEAENGELQIHDLEAWRDVQDFYGHIE